MTQSLTVALLVTLCLVYAAWTLAPRALRRWLAQRLLRQQTLTRWLPGAWDAVLQKAARSGAGGGCGCDASDGEGGCCASRSPSAAWQPVKLQPPRRR